jgi:hypothetical protein
MSKPERLWPEEGVCIGQYYEADEMDKYLDKQDEEIGQLKEFLRDALPHIECTNIEQDALITAIGEYLQENSK